MRVVSWFHVCVCVYGLCVCLPCTSLWTKASAKWLNVNVNCSTCSGVQAMKLLEPYCFCSLCSKCLCRKTIRQLITHCLFSKPTSSILPVDRVSDLTIWELFNWDLRPLQLALKNTTIRLEASRTQKFSFCSPVGPWWILPPSLSVCLSVCYYRI